MCVCMYLSIYIDTHTQYTQRGEGRYKIHAGNVEAARSHVGRHQDPRPPRLEPILGFGVSDFGFRVGVEA